MVLTEKGSLPVIPVRVQTQIQAISQDIVQQERRLEALQALWEWHEAHPDADE